MRYQCYKSAIFSSLVLFSASSYATIAVTTTSDSGTGSLRAAIQSANSSPGSTIEFSIPNGSTITLASSLPPITAAVNIEGGVVNPIIKGNNVAGIFYIETSNPVFLNNMTLIGGLAKGGAGGGGAGSGGSGGGGGAGGGGALCVIGTGAITTQGLTFSSNSAIGGAGGDAVSGGSAGGGGGGGFNGGEGGPSGNFHDNSGGGGGGGDPGGQVGAKGTDSNGGAGGAGGNGEPGGAGGTTVSFGAGGGSGGGNGQAGSPGHSPTAGAGGVGANALTTGGAGGGGYGTTVAFPGGNGGSGTFGGGGGGGGGGQEGGDGGTGGFGAGGGGGGGPFISGGGVGGPGGALGGAGGNGLSGGGGNGGGGGGGSGLGGAIFISSTSNVTLQDSPSISGNAAIGGTATRRGTSGAGYGQDIFLMSGGTLTFDISSSLALSNPIESDETTGGGGTGGGLVKTGIGTLYLNGVNTYTGGTTLQQGTLNANGTLLGAVTINFGATLSGTVSLITNGGIGQTGNLTNSGTVSPGNSIGDITIAGNYSQTSSGTLDIEISPSIADLLTISGSASLDGNLDITADPGTYSTGQTFMFLTATGGVSGTFSNVQISSYGGSLIPEIVYNANNVEILLTVLPSFASFSNVTGNAKKVANCLDNTFVVSGTDLGNVVGALHTLSGNDLKSALNQLQPSLFGALAMTEQESATLINASILDRIAPWYYKMPARCARAAQSTQSSESPSKEAPAKKVTLWVDGFYVHTHENRYSQQPGFTTNNEGFVVGSDYEFPYQIFAGVAAGYSHSNIHWMSDRGEGWINSGYGGLYLAWHNRYLFAETSIFGAYNKYHTKRHIEFSTIDRHAHGSHEGYEVLSNLDLGGNISWDNFLFQPFGRVDYLYLHEDGFNESGADSLDLKVSHKNSDMLRNELGVNFVYNPLREKWWSLTPNLKLSWVRETRFKGEHYRTEIEGAGCSLSVDTNPPTRNLFAPGAGLNFDYCDGSLGIFYEAEVGEHYWQQAVKLNWQMRF